MYLWHAQVSELTAIQDPPYRLNLFYSPDAMFEAVVRLTANQVTIKVLPRVALGLNAYTNGESNTLTIDYSKVSLSAASPANLM